MRWRVGFRRTYRAAAISKGQSCHMPQVCAAFHMQGCLHDPHMDKVSPVAASPDLPLHAEQSQPMLLASVIIVCWIACSVSEGELAMQVLASVPDLDIVAYLPLFLSSLMECLTDPLSEVRSKAAKVLQVSIPPSRPL